MQQTKFAEGKSIRQREIAAALIREGVAAEIVMKTTGLSEKEFALLINSGKLP